VCPRDTIGYDECVRKIPEWLRPKPTPEWSQVVLLAATAVQMASSLLLTIMAGRSLTPAEFGGFALVTTTFGLSHQFTDLGTVNVAVRAAARARDSERSVLENLLALRLILSILAGLACAGFALARTDGILRAMLLATSGVLVFSYASAFRTVFQLRQAQILPAILIVIAQLAAVAAAAVMLALSVDGGLLSGVIVAREAVVIVGTAVLAIGLLGYAPYPRFTRDALRSFFGVALIVALATIAYHFQLQGGPFWVQVMRPEEELGAFGAALRPLTPILMLPWLVMLPMVPLLSWLAVENRAAFIRQSQAGIDLLTGLGAVMAVATFELAEPLMAFLYGARFSEGALSAVGTLRWFALPLGASFAVAALSTILLADHREWSLLGVSAAGCVIYAVLNLLLLPDVGFVGSAIASACSVGVVAPAGMLILATIGVVPGKRTLAILFPAVMLIPILHFLPGPPFVHLLLAAPMVLAALAAVWRFPSLAASRQEQMALSREALARNG
jgi:O-antigen/teichoic acid export membrane protein